MTATPPLGLCCGHPLAGHLTAPRQQLRRPLGQAGRRGQERGGRRVWLGTCCANRVARECWTRGAAPAGWRFELANRGFSVVGIDSDAAMLDTARTKAPCSEPGGAPILSMRTRPWTPSSKRSWWLQENVMIFLTPGPPNARWSGQLADRLTPDGLLRFGFSAQH